MEEHASKAKATTLKKARSNTSERIRLNDLPLHVAPRCDPVDVVFPTAFGPTLHSFYTVLTCTSYRTSCVREYVWSGRRNDADAHQIERARMSKPLAAVRASIARDGSSNTVDPSVDTSSPLRRLLSWMVSA
jgi:hypothetical protein